MIYIYMYCHLEMFFCFGIFCRGDCCHGYILKGNFQVKLVQIDLPGEGGRRFRSPKMRVFETSKAIWVGGFSLTQAVSIQFIWVSTSILGT